MNFRSARDVARILSDSPDLRREVQVIEVNRKMDRPAGLRFGALVHAALAAVPLDADEAHMRETIAQIGRAHV